MTIAPEQISAYIQGLETQISDYKAWDQARRMVINYLKREHGLEDQYQWAFKTIELFEELKKLKNDTSNPERGAGDDYPVIEPQNWK